MADMLGGFRRRQVLGGVAAAGAAYCLPLGRAFADSGLSCVVQESGAPPEWPLVIAALITDAAADCDAKIAELRTQTSYPKPKQLLLRSNDPKRIPFAKALIDFFCANDNLRLVARVASNDAGDWPDTQPDQMDERYFVPYRSIYDAALIDFSGATVLVPRRGDRRNQRLRDYLSGLESHPAVAQESGPPSDLGQLAGLLASLIRTELTTTDDVDRAALVDYCKTKLRVGSLAALDSDKVAVVKVSI